MSDKGKVIQFPKKKQQQPLQAVMMILPKGNRIQPVPEKVDIKKVQDTLAYKIGYSLTVFVFLGFLMAVAKWSLM